MEEQVRHYANKLAFETDSWDLKVALESGENVVVVDARSPEVYQREHIPGAVNIPHREMSEETTKHNEWTRIKWPQMHWLQYVHHPA